MSASSKARVIQRETGLHYTACLKLVTGERILTSVVKECLYRDALEDLAAQQILRRWAKRTNQVIGEPQRAPEGGYRLQLPDAKGSGSTPAKARLDAALQLVDRDPSLASTPPRPPKEIVVCDCPRCDP